MGSHSITCHPTQVNATRITAACRLVLDLPTPEPRDGGLRWPSWLDSPPAGSRTSDLSITSPTPNLCTTKTTLHRIELHSIKCKFLVKFLNCTNFYIVCHSYYCHKVIQYVQHTRCIGNRLKITCFCSFFRSGTDLISHISAINRRHYLHFKFCFIFSGCLHFTFVRFCGVLLCCLVRNKLIDWLIDWLSLRALRHVVDTAVFFVSIYGTSLNRTGIRSTRWLRQLRSRCLDCAKCSACVRAAAKLNIYFSNKLRERKTDVHGS